MNVRENVYVAVANLKANKVRTVFSMLGIVIGTCSVIVVISIVNGTRMATLRDLTEGKENMIILRPNYSEATGRFGSISLEDIERIKRLPSVLTAFPDVMLETEARGRHGKDRVTFFGVNHYYPSLYNLKLVSGRFFTEAETNGRPYITVISHKKAQKLFGFDYPIGQRVRLEDGVFEVIGVYKDEERLKRMDQYEDAIVPINTLIGLIKDFRIYAVQIRSQPGKIDAAVKDINDLIVSSKQSELLSMTDIRQYYKDTEKWAKTWLIQMGLIAAVSLLVGGVGLMNVMLISVTERTHEIGLRKALGANYQMILQQFLVESITLSGIGGLVGVFLGVLISSSLAILSNNKILVQIMPLSVVGSFVFSLIVGVVFGLFPASKAAHLSPVEALRYE